MYNDERAKRHMLYIYVCGLERCTISLRSHPPHTHATASCPRVWASTLTLHTSLSTMPRACMVHCDPPHLLMRHPAAEVQDLASRGGVRGGCSDLAGSPSAARSSLPSEAHLGLRQPFPWRGKRGAARRLPVRALQRAAASQVHRAVDCRACWPHRPAMPRGNTASCARCSTPEPYPLSASCPEHSSAAPQSDAQGTAGVQSAHPTLSDNRAEI
jgi:hypothetical protein